jgi:hypothetical protein
MFPRDFNGSMSSELLFSSKRVREMLLDAVACCAFHLLLCAGRDDRQPNMDQRSCQRREATTKKKKLMREAQSIYIYRVSN